MRYREVCAGFVLWLSVAAACIAWSIVALLYGWWWIVPALASLVASLVMAVRRFRAADRLHDRYLAAIVNPNRTNNEIP